MAVSKQGFLLRSGFEDPRFLHVTGSSRAVRVASPNKRPASFVSVFGGSVPNLLSRGVPSMTVSFETVKRDVYGNVTVQASAPHVEYLVENREVIALAHTSESPMTVDFWSSASALATILGKVKKVSDPKVGILTLNGDYKFEFAPVSSFKGDTSNLRYGIPQIDWVSPRTFEAGQAEFGNIVAGKVSNPQVHNITASSMGSAIAVMSGSSLVYNLVNI